MKIVLNEIIDELYEAVKKCNIDTGVQPLMRCVARLKMRYSESVIMEGFAWLSFTLYQRLSAAEAKLKKMEEKK